MGALRFFLALAVVLVHVKIDGLVIFPSAAAVQVFYMLSGFYMALTLDGRAISLGNYRKFLISRILRIIPVVMIVSVLTAVVGLLALSTGRLIPPFEAWRRFAEIGEVRTVALLVVPQVIVIGEDLFYFSALTDVGLRLTSNFHDSTLELWRVMFVPQAWSLSLELYFYCIVPLLVGLKVRYIFLIAVASVCLRGWLALGAGYIADPWSYRFFPSELVYFCSGMIAYNCGSRSVEKGWRQLATGGVMALTCLLLLTSGAMQRGGLGARMLMPAVVACVFCSIWWLFSRTKNLKHDRLIGDLSYPLYVCHILILWIVDLCIPQASPWMRGALIVSISIAFSIVLAAKIDRQVGSWRRNALCLA